MKSSVYSSVSEAVMAARGAFGRYSELTLNERNEILEAVRTAVRPKIAELAEMTVAETGMGNVADKIEKLKLAVEKTPCFCQSDSSGSQRHGYPHIQQ